ncbi:MAG TPA: tRNA pseudouridine(55) synthase TruB [Candidatus Sulfotelmatobacter sp.]|jgi:tRNA pseudouridine55 synthase
MNAVLIIDKPAGLTSHDVVNRARRILHERSIGHLGTLDPLATGVLPLVTGNLTRIAQFYTASEKTYEGVIRFGFATDTYDAAGEPTTTPQEIHLDAGQIESLAGRFRGVIEQIPPPFSAKKIKGVPAYKLARRQKEVVLQPVQVEIKEFAILAVDSDRVHFRARVASGTYMRSVAHDMGRELACGAHLESLRRTAVAEFTLEDAHTLEELAQLSNQCHPGRSSAPPQGEQSAVERPPVEAASNVISSNLLSSNPTSPELESFFIHPRKLLPNFPSVTADDSAAAFIRSGRTVNLPDFSRAPQVKVFTGQRTIIAIATRIAGTLFHPKIVLA